MAKGKFLGLAGPDDPIYRSGVTIQLIPGLASPDAALEPAASPMHEVVTVDLGQYAVVCDYINWDAGSCLDGEIPRIALCASLDDAQQLFATRCALLTSVVEKECELVGEVSDLSWEGQSGYTGYCILFVADHPRDKAGWSELVSDIADEDPTRLQSLLKRYAGFNATPDSDGFYPEAIPFADVQDWVFDVFT